MIGEPGPLFTVVVVIGESDCVFRKDPWCICSGTSRVSRRCFGLPLTSKSDEPCVGKVLACRSPGGVGDEGDDDLDTGDGGCGAVMVLDIAALFSTLGREYMLPVKLPDREGRLLRFLLASSSCGWL